VVLLDDGKVRLDRDLDTLQEDYCVAFIPSGSAPDAETIERLPGCLRARPVFGDWHAVFEGTPDSVRRQLGEALGIEGIQCVRVPLEELFVELVGSNRLVEAS
jgi:hypothetical protein